MLIINPYLIEKCASNNPKFFIHIKFEELFENTKLFINFLAIYFF